MYTMNSEVAQLPLLGETIFFKAFQEIRGVADKQSYGEWHPRWGQWFCSGTPDQTPAVLCSWDTRVATGLGVPLFSFWEKSTLKELLLFCINLKGEYYYYFSHNTLTVVIANLYRHTSLHCPLSTLHFSPMAASWQPSVEHACRHIPPAAFARCASVSHLGDSVICHAFPLLHLSRWPVLNEDDPLKAHMMVTIFQQ